MDTEQMSELLSRFRVDSGNVHQSSGFDAQVWIPALCHGSYARLIMGYEDPQFFIILKIPPLQPKLHGGATGHYCFP